MTTVTKKALVFLEHFGKAWIGQGHKADFGHIDSIPAITGHRNLLLSLKHKELVLPLDHGEYALSDKGRAALKTIRPLTYCLIRQELRLPGNGSLEC